MRRQERTRTDRLPRRRVLQYLLVGGGVALGASTLVQRVSLLADAPQRSTPHGDVLETVPQGELPSFARTGSPKAQEAYRYAATHGEILQYIPCFCGCTNVGHHHNGDCYVAERLPGGRLTFTSHGAA
ncbi:MAG: PCYCGC motif-containing (lipo)protein [Candidatus Tectimicrobiota bacterium]